ncbi:MAG TPA: hypothetical protein H9668_08705 [Firmicutes bacterium]|nr:hypothetical protein [Bacillota bacterium]
MFYKPKHSSSSSAKIKRKIGFLFTLVAVAVVCYSVTVYAYFQASVFNGGNTIRVGSYAAKVEILAEDQTVLWSSGEEIRGYGDEVPLQPAAVPAALRITNTGGLAFQYQVCLTAGNTALLYKTADDSADKLILPKGESVTYALQGTEAVSELWLEFRTAFQKGELQNPIEPPAEGTAGAPADRKPAPALEPQQAGEPVGNTAAPVSSTVPALNADESSDTSSRETEESVSLPETSRPAAEEESSQTITSEPAATSAPETAADSTASGGESSSSGETEPVADGQDESR